MPDTFEGAEANPGDGGLIFAYDSFTDGGGNIRALMFSGLVLPDGVGYTRVSDTYGLPVKPATGQTFPVSAAGLPLPTGAATAANQATEIIGLAAIVTALGSTLAVAGTIGGTVAVSSLPTLPAGDNNIGNVDVLTLPAIPAGNNNIGDVDVASIAAGDNNIGNVDVLTLPAIPAGNNNIGDVDVLTLPALPAGTNLVGKIAAAEDAKLLYDGTTGLTVKHANIDTATSGNNEIVAAVGGKVLRVVSLFLSASGAVDVYWNDATANLLGGTRKVKLDNTGATGAVGFALQENLKGWFKTAAANRPLNLNLSGAVGVAGCVSYVEADA